MPFFSRQHEEPEPEPPVVEEEPRKRGLLGSLRRDPSPTPTAQTTSSYRTSRSSTTSASSTTAGRPARGHSLLHKFGGRGDEELDPSIVQARERVLSAENAEHEADRALEMARREVREAREEVKRLEIEAREEARRAKIKAFHAKEVSKRGKALGRELTSPFSSSLCMSTTTTTMTVMRTGWLTCCSRPRPVTGNPCSTTCSYGGLIFFVYLAFVRLGAL